MELTENVYGMGNIERQIERQVREKFKEKLGLVNLDMKESREALKNLQRKYNLLHKRVVKLESERGESTDYGV